MARRIFWSYGKDGYGEESGRMYFEDGQVFLECTTWDGEDRRGYDYGIAVSAKDYQAAMAAMQSGETARLAGIDGGELVLRLLKADQVGMRLSGTPSPNSTPGGASLSGSMPFNVSLGSIQLLESEIP